jgi:putative methyltransferase (TIGR04325 family)
MKKLIKKIPFVEPIYQQYKEAQYRRRFANDCYGCFWGVFETFDEAIKAAPKTKSIGYDNASLAQEYEQMLEQNNWENSGRTFASYDYPVVFWLNKIFQQQEYQTQEYPTIFDFGGNLGVHFYSYANYIDYPQNLQWTVCDLPEIINVGRKIAIERDVKNLNFTDKFEDINQDIFLASGSIQYVENLSGKLASCEKRPKHLLINRVPLYDGAKFVTLQNGGRVFYPQYIFNKTQFIDELNEIGYELVDIWQDNITSCFVPFHSDKSVPYYSGLYLRNYISG